MLRVVSDTAAQRSLARFRTSAQPAVFGSGFYDQERDDVYLFRWMQTHGQLEVGAIDSERFLELWVFCCLDDFSQRLTIEGGEEPFEVVLPYGWSRFSVAVTPGVDRIHLRVDKPFPASNYPEDSRTLAIRVRSGAYVHQDPDRHRMIALQSANEILNWQEALQGRSRLESTPPILGIDMYGVCNVKPPCVYCEWDKSKEMEGDNVDAPFTRQTLEEWGDLFTRTRNLVNCSIGEPFMMKNVDELFDIYGDSGKTLEMATNGQILTDRNIEKLLDRDIELYISLDAATPETYAKLRNDTFERILDNLRRLIAAKGGRDGLPRVHLVFMPMRCNVHELATFVDLCDQLQVDRMVLRPLNYADAIYLRWDRAGYTFDYQKELLPFDELIRVSARAAQLCREHGVPFSDQMDFGGAMSEMFAEEFESQPGEAPAPLPQPQPQSIAPPAEREPSPEKHTLVGAATTLPEPQIPDSGAASPAGEGDARLPACLEPWRSLYILRRGILPCCYGGTPIADMDGYADVWNSDTLREIRAELAAGRFHKYCLDSPSCPIVRKNEHAGELPRSQALFLRARHLWHRFDRLCFGVPGYIFRPSKWVAMRLWAAVTDPTYVRRHVWRLYERKK